MANQGIYSPQFRIACAFIRLNCPVQDLYEVLPYASLVAVKASQHFKTVRIIIQCTGLFKITDCPLYHFYSY